ncbi:bifunctional ADP-dependent NAD(P)H-hydrate dehydratase/NAD(P)H-hydrate epimerase [Bacillaceae bacterium SAS-127]|nr:bifunctional ADP-dependent NAD(P)H-hydrate dehydratase/NAD(P)H-hydrate epimerase [Bacillaceae bacterium SAS-127]
MYIYTSDQIKLVDEEAANKGMSTFTLMENAGSGLFRALTSLLCGGEKIAILCGKGNNGGDGIVLARYLKMAGMDVDLLLPVGEPVTNAAKQHLDYYQNLGYTIEDFNEEVKYDVIIDSLLGVGAKQPLSNAIKQLTSWANEQSAIRIAIDLPTGVFADHGKVDEATFRADHSLHLHGYKPACFLFPSSEFFGEKHVIDIGLAHNSSWKVWTAADVRSLSNEAPQNAHKGSFGHGLLIAGSNSMPGSAALAAIGAVRTGIGKLTIQTTPYVAAVIAHHAPEATYHFESNMDELLSFDGVAIGCGLAPTDELETSIQRCLTEEFPLILDAGALSKRNYRLQDRKANVIVTPHPGEFARMTGQTVQEIQMNRLEAASQFAKEQQVIVVLKGQYSVIAFPDGTGIINTSGNEALAKGGTGDTLTGMILASILRMKNDRAAIAHAVFLHGACADMWVESNGRSSMAAHDINHLLPFVLKKIIGGTAKGGNYESSDMDEKRNSKASKMRTHECSEIYGE